MSFFVHVHSGELYSRQSPRIIAKLTTHTLTNLNAIDLEDAIKKAENKFPGKSFGIYVDEDHFKDLSRAPLVVGNAGRDTGKLKLIE